ncbi:sigma-70 family RNA polymerase sigma factor [Dictyobacter arantiisoli]|uniref:Uncharacterized protein n=1 Tax=Dictyobacter arantiisoli TaxID=2014874 RepID=A0A5A5TCQ9_9CHLR|nr:sigma-70 family RNA polymerase sigma factor [Dictyobacter arantiisoli]GCF08813.1 hypothetical protein KDI_23770 [Dictyobacter arantiisoli]
MSVQYAAVTTDLAPPLPVAVSPPRVQRMSLTELVKNCQVEMQRYCRGEADDECYALEIFRRAMKLHDPLAWDALQQCFSGLVFTWMRRHSRRERACSLDSEENYVAQAFTRFWQASINNAELHFFSLASALNYLRASLNGAIMDTLRVYTHLNEIPLPDANDSVFVRELAAEEHEDGDELWQIVCSLLSGEREKRLAYLYFHCGLKAREIVQFCPDEFHDVQEVYRLRHNIFKRLTRNADQIRWRLSSEA